MESKTNKPLRLIAKLRGERPYTYVPTGIQRGRSESTDWQPQTKPLPTSYWPGTIEKIEVMRRRMERREELFHEGDAGGF